MHNFFPILATEVKVMGINAKYCYLYKEWFEAEDVPLGCKYVFKHVMVYHWLEHTFPQLLPVAKSSLIQHKTFHVRLASLRASADFLKPYMESKDMMLLFSVSLLQNLGGCKARTASWQQFQFSCPLSTQIINEIRMLLHLYEPNPCSQKHQAQFLHGVADTFTFCTKSSLMQDHK